MTLSDQDRLDERRTILLHMADSLGDQDVRQVTFASQETAFAVIHATTWRELLDDNLIDDAFSSMTSTTFRLTTFGWIRALVWSGAVDEAGFRSRCVRLAQGLKAVVKGRVSHRDEFIHLRTLAANTSLPEGWVSNAIRSRLLSVVFPKDRWDTTFEKGMIRVSPTLGLNHVDEEKS